MAQGAVERMIARLSAVYPNDRYGDPRSGPLCALLTPHLLAQKTAEAKEMSTLANWSTLLNSAGNYFWGRGSFVQAASRVRDALAIREKVLGPEHPDTAAGKRTVGGRGQHCPLTRRGGLSSRVSLLLPTTKFGIINIWAMAAIQR
jgi:Tetratricopeptide repeat